MSKLVAAAALLFAPSLAAGQGDLPQTADRHDARLWEQVEPYGPPDFEGFFPDDAEGGAALDELIEGNRLRGLGDAEYIETVRRGLRRTSSYRTNILSELGKRFIWGVEAQDPDAIEICYHAADFREEVRSYGTRHRAVYFGLSVVNEKSPAILRTLADLCVAVDDPNDIGRVAWGASSQMDELLPYLDPHLASTDEYVRSKAESVAKIFRGELGAFEWATERARQPPRPRPWVEMPEVRAALREGDSAARLAVLARIRAERLTRDMNDSYLADFALAATDPEPAVRESVAITVGNHWIWRAGLHLISPAAVELMLHLSRDPEGDVRHSAVYYGLSTYRGESDAVLRRMLDMTMDVAEARSHGRLLWGLGKYEERAARALEEDLAGDDPARARGAYDVYWRLFERAPSIVPPGIAQPADLVGTWQVTLEAPPGEQPRPFGVVISRGEDGALSIASEGAQEPGARPLRDLLCTSTGGVLHFDFSLTIETAVLRTTGRLEDDALSGTARFAGLDTLFVWSAERAPR